MYLQRPQEAREGVGGNNQKITFFSMVDSDFIVPKKWLTPKINFNFPKAAALVFSVVFAALVKFLP